MSNQIFRWGYIHLGAVQPDDMLIIPRLKADMEAVTDEEAEEVILLVSDNVTGFRLINDIATLLKTPACAVVYAKHAFVSELHFDDRLRYGFGELVYATGEISVWPRVWSPRNCDFRGDMDNTDRDGAYKRYKLDWRRKDKLELFHHDWVEGRRDEALKRIE